MFAKYSIKDLIAKITLFKLLFIFIAFTGILWSPSFLIDGKVKVFAYGYSAVLLSCVFILLYLQSSQLLTISKELSIKEKVAVALMWFFASTIIIVSFSILHALVNTSNSSNYIYFSVITFTTVGYGDVSPEGWLAYIFCGLEAFLGLFSLGILIASVTKVFTLEKVKLWHLFTPLLLLIIIPSLIYGDTGIIDNDTKEVSKCFFDALYFSTATLTTLGYGDFYPTKDSQVTVIFQSFLGYLYFGVFAATVAKRYFPFSRAEE